MARVIGTPGESAAARGLLFVVAPVVLILVFVGGPSLWALSRSAEQSGCAGLLLTLATVAGVFYFRRSDLRTVVEAVREGTQFLKGARGEILVHQALKALPDEFIVFHDFHPVDLTTGKAVRWNVDHIVVGPTGVFVIDAKYYGRPQVLCAAKSSFTRANAKQVQRNALELKDRLARWSRGDLAGLFVVPVVVYTQPDAHLERLREGAVRTIPLRLLLNEVQSHSEGAIDQEKAGRISRVLFAQLSGDLQAKFKPEFDAYGELSKAARYAARDARVSAQAEAETAAPEVSAVPEVCPRCGGALVRKVARYGERAGKPFLGCANYTKTGCRYGFNFEE